MSLIAGEQHHQERAQPEALLVLSMSGQRQRAEEQQRSDAGTDRRLGEGDVYRVHQGEQTGREQAEDASQHGRGEQVAQSGHHQRRRRQQNQ